MQYVRMAKPTPMNARLKEARKLAGYVRGSEAARAIGIPESTFLAHENGTRGFPVDVAERYARFFRVNFDWLLRGHGKPRGSDLVPVIGYIGAGAEVFPVDDYPQGGGMEMVEPPPGVPNCVAARIRGDSQWPLRDGWTVFWHREQEGIAEDCIGKLCVVQVHEGPLLLKELMRGSRPGKWTLQSWNAPVRQDVRVDWASKVLDIRPV
jgi:DNA-binding XRE family transcriptional regulator